MSEIMDKFTPEGDFMGMDWSAGNKQMEKAQKETKKNEAEAPLKAAAEAARIEEERTQKEKQRAAIFNAPTSGFGSRGNTARQFLTSF